MGSTTSLMLDVCPRCCDSHEVELDASKLGVSQMIRLGDRVQWHHELSRGFEDSSPPGSPSVLVDFFGECHYRRHAAYGRDFSVPVLIHQSQVMAVLTEMLRYAFGVDGHPSDIACFFDPEAPPLELPRHLGHHLTQEHFQLTDGNVGREPIAMDLTLPCDECEGRSRVYSWLKSEDEGPARLGAKIAPLSINGSSLAFEYRFTSEAYCACESCGADAFVPLYVEHAQIMGVMMRGWRPGYRRMWDQLTGSPEL